MKKKKKKLTQRKVIKSPVYHSCRFGMSTKKLQNLVKIIPKIITQRKKVKHKLSAYARCSICLFDETKNRRYF